MKHVGFIGLGDQGAPIVAAIAEADVMVHVWARRRETLEAVAGIPHAACESVPELGATCDLVGLCVRDDDDVRGLLEQLLPRMRPDAIVANHGTGSPAVCAEFEAMGAAHGVVVLDAPVSGGSEGARRRTLTTMVGGDAAAAAVCRPLFDTFSSLVAYLGPAGSGQLAKLVNNALFTANLHNSELLLAMAAALDIELASLTEVVRSSSGSSFALAALATQMRPELVAQYHDILLKDIEYFAAAVRERGVDPTVLEARSRDGVEGIAAAVALMTRL